jgi:hypothetical protein
VPDAASDDPVCIFAREFFGVSAKIRVRRTVCVALERDGGHGGDGTRRQLLFKVIILPLSLGQSETPAIVVNDDGDVVRAGLENLDRSISGFSA